MTDTVRILNDAGIAKFREYIGSLRAGQLGMPPDQLLTDPSTSDSFNPPIAVQRSPERKLFSDRYDFGVYLRGQFASVGPAVISMNYRLWTWLALYYFDQLCPADDTGIRAVLADEAYIVHANFRYEEYYRHLVRTPWVVASLHGDRSRVLLIPASGPSDRPLSTRGEIIEQLAARQRILGNPAIVAGAYRMYFDETKGRPKRGAGGSGPGSPRRLGLVVQQLELTYDLAACTPDEVIELLPREFDRWEAKAAPVLAEAGTS